MSAVSVVVPVLNASRTLPACLAALARLSPPPLELLLVDNGSTDGSVQILETFAKNHNGAARVLTEPRRGAAAARNAGIRVARGQVVAFTDADCEPEERWLDGLLEPFADPSVGAVAGRVIAAPASSLMELFSALLHPSVAGHTKPTPHLDAVGGRLPNGESGCPSPPPPGGECL